MNIDNVCKTIVEKGFEKIFIFPYGNIGMEVHNILKNRYGIKTISIVDNKLCKYNPLILSLESMVDIDWNNKNYIMICASNNKIIYNELRIRINKYVPKEKIIDLFDLNPLCNDSDARISSLAMTAKEIYRKNIKGSVAEAGVYRGDFSKYINMLFPDRKLYLFDSFKGFNSDNIVYDKDNINQTSKWIHDARDTSVEYVLSQMNYPNNIEVRKGFIPDTLKGIEDKFAFVSLDMDLYLPTKAALEFFWSKLCRGGYIFIHDFGYWDGIEKAVIEFCKKRKLGYFCLTDAMTVVISKSIE